MFDTDLLIGGQGAAAQDKATFERRSPATGEVVTRAAAAQLADVDRAVKAAQDAFPAWSAMARVPRMIGAFHGARPTTTPQAWRRPIAIEPGTSDGMTSPLIWVVIDAASRSMLPARVTLN